MVKLSLAYFDTLLILSQAFAFTFVVCAGFFYNSLGWGFQWGEAGITNSGNMNLHGTFMSIGMVFLQGEAILSYRLYRHDAKLLSKFVHVALHCLAIAFAGCGLYCIIEHKNLHGFKHFYSFHSWLGIALLAAYLVQFTFGLLNYGLGVMPLSIRASFLPLHRVLGLLIFGVTGAQALLGSITYVDIASKTVEFSCYNSFSCSSHLDAIFNTGMVCLVLYAVTVGVLVTPAVWRRQKTPDEEN